MKIIYAVLYPERYVDAVSRRYYHNFYQYTNIGFIINLFFKVLDEIQNILKRAQDTAMIADLPVHEILRQLRTLSAAAVAHFKLAIIPRISSKK